MKTDLSKSFHTWGARWTPSQIDYYYDGKFMYTGNIAKYPQGDQQIWLTSIGYGTLPQVAPEGEPDMTADFDYVRYYAPPTEQ